MLGRSSLGDTRSPTDQEVAAHYEDRGTAAGLARLYEAATPLGEFYRGRMRRVAGLLEGVQGELLDVGCGTGQMIRYLRDSRPGQFALTGLDRSASILAEARRVVDDDPAVRLVTGRVERMPFAPATFDVVLAMGILEYVASTEQAVREIARVTRPGGLAIVTMQNPRSPYRLWDAIVWSRVRRRRRVAASPIVGRLRVRRLRTTLAAAGLTPLSVVYYGFDLLLPPLDSRFPKLAIRLQRGLDGIVRGLLRRIASDYLVVARRT